MGWPPDVLAATVMLVAVLAWAVAEWANGRPPRHAVATMGRHLLLEAFRRYAFVPPKPQAPKLDRVHRFMDELFGRQREVVDAIFERGLRRLAAYCTRRAGKTTLFAFLLLYTALRFPGVLCTYYAITRIRAKQLIWEELQRLNRVYALGFTFNSTELEAKSPTGSTIRLTGADKLSEAQKKLGDKNKLAIVDEAQLYDDRVLDLLVNRVLRPTLMDLRGAMVLGGTPGLVCAGLWYGITRNEDEVSEDARAPGWEVFEWSLFENPALPHAREEVESEIKDLGLSWTSPSVLREYGDQNNRPRWVNDEEGRFWAFSPTRNTYDGNLPDPGRHTWMKVVGVDLGEWFAIEVWAFAETHDTLFEVESVKVKGKTPSEWVEMLEDAIERHGPIAVAVDYGGLGVHFITEWQTRFGLPVEPAEKQKKAAFVALMNDDLMRGKVKLLVDSPLAKEMSTLQRSKDDPAQPAAGMRDDSADAGLYGWRHAYHYLGRDEESGKSPPGSPERENAEARRRKEEAEDRAAREQEDDDWGGGGNWDE